MRSRTTAPARTGLRAGVVAFLTCLGATGCDRVPGVGDDGPRVLELAHDTIRLEAGVRLVEVGVRRQQDGDFDPAAIEARQGDYVRFTAQDRAGHAIAFQGAQLDAAAREFLERTGQLRGPPLITSDASWVITLEDAPPGAYPFHCTTHNVAGRLSVVAR